MKPHFKNIIFSGALFFFSVLAFSQQKDIHRGKDIVVIKSIEFEGNKKTKEPVLLRELPFEVGDQLSLKELIQQCETGKKLLLNTTLFHDVRIEIKKLEENQVTVQVVMKERWYLFPFPYFRYIDRNLNQWLFEQNGNLDRVNYGVKLLYNNVSGQRDKLNLWLMNGYTRQVTLNYSRPYLDKNMKWGMSAGMATGKNREINYQTINNKQIFYKDSNRFIRSFIKLHAEASYRPAIRTIHRFGFGFSEERVHDTVVSLNPQYFKNGRQKIGFPEFYYTLNYFDVDYIPYPLEGYMAEASFYKKGLNNQINLWQLTVKGSGNWKLADKTWLGSRASFSLKFPFRQPYFTQRMLGYNDFFMQGYEYYVIDGVAGGYLKTTITREILNFNLSAKRKKQPLLKVPFRVFAKAYANAGYIHHPQPGIHVLNNRMLYSGGLGIDILTQYDFTIKLEWSFNQLGQNGLYLHRKTIF